jgi:hypothetical protein
VDLSGDVTIANTGAATVTNAAGNMRVVGDLKVVGTDDDASPDSIITGAAGVLKKSSATLFTSSTLNNTNIYVGNGSNVAAGVAMSGDATIANTGAVTVSNAAGNMRVNGTMKINGSTEDASPDSMLTINAGTIRTTATSKFVSSTLNSANILVGSVGNAATAVSMSGDATISNAGAVTVSNAAANMRVVGTLKVVGSTEDASPDSILTIAAGIVRTTASAKWALATVVKTAIVETHEVATADSVSGRYYFVPAHVPIATSVAVDVNGVNLVPTTQYSIVSNKIRVGFNLGLYDKLRVSYSY